MAKNLERAQRYYQRAENLRALATQDENAETREALLAVANGYDRLALKALDCARQNHYRAP